jgi:hypothetical protein
LKLEVAGVCEILVHIYQTARYLSLYYLDHSDYRYVDMFEKGEKRAVCVLVSNWYMQEGVGSEGGSVDVWANET